MRARGFLAAASALALTACAAGPPPEVATPVPVLPDAFLFAPDPSASASLAALMPVADPAFDTLAAQALASSPTLGEAAARVEEARAGADRAGDERLPEIGANGSVTGQRSNPGSFGGGCRREFPSTPSGCPTLPMSPPAGISTCSAGCARRSAARWHASMPPMRAPARCGSRCWRKSRQA
ncbi:hypothetical protein WKH79_00285 [Qipengyuania sp. GPGPB31]|uniref:hypothetical protein n=1 Tax=Qipengyuania sp. GPGPB31 TaxID=3023518 RepID=UPI0031343DD7